MWSCASLRSVVVLALAALPVAIISCSDPPPKPAAGQGSSNPVGGGGGGGGSGEGGIDSGAGIDAGDGGVCNDLVNVGQTIDRVGILGDPPVAKGGVIADGTYVLTEYAAYVGAGGVAGPTGITGKATLRIQEGKLDELIEYGGSGNPSARSASSAYTPTAATFATTELCPTTAGRTRQFTSNDPVLVLQDLTTKEAFTFTKR